MCQFTRYYLEDAAIFSGIVGSNEVGAIDICLSCFDSDCDDGDDNVNDIDDVDVDDHIDDIDDDIDEKTCNHTNSEMYYTQQLLTK